MTFNFELQDELQALADVQSYEIPNEHDPESEDTDRLLEGAVESVAESSDAIADPEVFDVYRSILKRVDSAPGAVMSKILDSISSGLASELEVTMRDTDNGDQQSCMAHKLPLELYAFLLHWFVSAAEKVKQPEGEEAPAAAKPKKGRGGKAGGGKATGRGAANRRKETFTWIEQIPATLALISKVLRLKTQRIWTATAERDTFVNCVTRVAHNISESEQYMKVHDIRMGVYKVICLSVKHHGQGMATQIIIMQNLQFYEHLSEPMAECLSFLTKEFDHAQLGDEILREIARKDFSSADKKAAQDTKGPRSIARFLVKFAELSPRSVLKQLSLLLNQLDSESWPIRTALIEVVGYLIAELASSDASSDQDSQQLQKQISGLYDLLIERMLDMSSYVRSKVLSVFSKLCEMKAKFPKQRLAVTRAAVSALEDKVATVRKNAAGLLAKLLLTHPYGLVHGGTLALQKFESEYKAVKEQLDKLEGAIGNAVERQQGDDDDDEERASGEEDKENEEEDQDDGDGMDEDRPSRRKGKKAKKRSRKRGQDDMDVDGENEEEEEDGDVGGDDEGQTDEAETDDAMDEDGEENGGSHGRKKKAKVQRRKSQLDVVALSNEQAALAALEGTQVLHLRLRKKYYAEALNFIRQINGAMETMARLLGSTNKSEVLEVMEFFRVAHEYQFDEAQTGIKRMLHLIWHKDNNSSTTDDPKEQKGIRLQLLECYRNLYFDPLPDPELEPQAQVNRITKNMIELTYKATLAELTSLEEMMRILMDKDAIHHDVIGKLWQVYSAKRALPAGQRRGAIIILGMLALAKRSVLTDHVDVMLRVGLGGWGKADLGLVRYTCIALQRLNGSAKKIKGSLLDKTLRIEIDNPIFRRLQEAVEQPCRSKEWFGLAEQVINTVYALGEHPDIFCDELIKKLSVRAFTRRQKPPPETQDKETSVEKDPDAMNEDEPENPSQAEVSKDSTQNSPPADDKDLGDAFELSQLLFVVGHVAIKHIVYLELVERELKRQKDEKRAAEKRAAPNQGAKDKEAEELDQVVGNAEDEIGDRISGIRETELLHGEDSLLSIYGPMIVHICGSPHKFKNRTLRGAATLAFSKFLCVSSQFCDQHHRLLFKILETSKDPQIRGNIVIALGDVAVSFSNIIDENSNELYKGLSDRNFIVKKNTLMVLTHLILNGMIKVKGQLGEMAKCLEDEEPRIADLAKLFFEELSTKDNAIYNNLPDVISHLSTGDHAVDEEAFQSTVKYIFKFIEKDKQAEAIVEKLCQRFRLTDDPRQWRDIAYCLSLLPYKSEKSVKKLIEGIQFYRDKLHEPVVYERFTEILTKARGNKSKDKPDSELNEFDQILKEHKRQGEEDQALEKRVEGKKTAAKKRASRRARKKVQERESDDDAYA